MTIAQNIINNATEARRLAVLVDHVEDEDLNCYITRYEFEDESAIVEVNDNLYIEKNNKPFYF